MTANELAEQLEKHAQLLDNILDFPKAVRDIREAATMLVQLQNANDATAKLNYQKGFEFGSSLTTYNKPAMEKLQAEISNLNDKIDKLLNHCPDPECWECGKIICPYGGEMHFHHDGCPTCAEMEYENDQNNSN